jgi:hypothetical protein
MLILDEKFIQTPMQLSDDADVAFENGVFIFDFDGVLSSPLEDDIYKLPPSDDEISLIRAGAEKFIGNCRDMDIRYQRHLVFQAAAWTLGHAIDPGTGIDLARRASRISRLFVLTARSGWYATERMRNFLRNHSVLPLEVFSVGRVQKDRQLAFICKEFKDRNVFFFEDSPAHLDDAISLKIPNLAPIRVGRPPTTASYEISLRKRFTETVFTALQTDTPAAFRNG